MIRMATEGRPNMTTLRQALLNAKLGTSCTPLSQRLDTLPLYSRTVGSTANDNRTSEEDVSEPPGSPDVSKWSGDLWPGIQVVTFSKSDAVRTLDWVACTIALPLGLGQMIFCRVLWVVPIDSGKK